MATNTLVDKAPGNVIDETFFNDIHSALSEDFVGRNTSRAPEAGKNLGNSTYPWGTIFGTSLVLGGSTIDTTGLSGNPYKIISGRVRSGFYQPALLVANGGTNAVTVKATATPLVIEARGTRGTFSADINVTGLTVAPGSANTCTINDASITGQPESLQFGETWSRTNPNKIITITGAGANITSKVGQIICFKFGTEPTAEYMVGYLRSSTEFTAVHRGYFFDSSEAPRKRKTISNGNTLTIMSLGWVFADVNGSTIDVTYKNPIYSVSTPGSPATGDYWYDILNAQMKRYDGAVFQPVNRVPIGYVVVDTSVCIAARSFDFDALYSDFSTLRPRWASASTVETEDRYNSAIIAGNRIFRHGPNVKWDMASHLAATSELDQAGEQASKYYFFYLDKYGQRFISDMDPTWRGDLGGLYHRQNPWRCFGFALNDAGSNLTSGSFVDLSRRLQIENRDYEGSSITRNKLATAGLVNGSVVASFTTTSGTYVATGLSVTITVEAGRPTRIKVESDNSAGSGSIYIERTGSGSVTLGFRIVRDGSTVLRYFTLDGSFNAASRQGNISTVINMIDEPSAGVHTYTLEAAVIAGATGAIIGSRLTAIEEF